ncbi:MAG TPA: glutaredoxin family protein [Desulfohalobiaceae bacterium]|nr:glutaredoxin family protein [Desulfohalobiaceae bacterium]
MDNNVKLYALSTCIHCKHTKELLDEKGINYDYTYVDTLSGDEKKDILEEVKQYNPKLSFPTLLINEQCIVGFKKQEIEEALQGNASK